MELSSPSLWACIYLLLAGLLVALAIGARLVSQRTRVSLDRHRTLAERPDATRLIIGPADVIVVGPSEEEPCLIVGPSEPILVGPSEPIVVIGPPEPLVVEPPPRGMWEDRGWTRCDQKNGREVYEGYFQVTRRRTGQPCRYQGCVIVDHREVVPYIADPPGELRDHPKWPCFTLVKAPWFRLEWERPAQNVDDAILYVEKVLDEALNKS
jgi:hypothetical protein